MKVFFEALAADVAEFAVVHLHQRDAAANRLVAYLEQECFRSVRLLCRRDAQTVPVTSESICAQMNNGDAVYISRKYARALRERFQEGTL